MEYFNPETGEVTDRIPLTPVEQVRARTKSVARTRTKVRRAIQSLGADRMITLTYRENQCELSEAWRDLAKCLRRLRAALGGFSYVVVAERQKRGAWHFHLAAFGRQDLKLWQEAWPHGWIRVDRWKGPLHKMAGYMSKYVTKSFSDLNEDAHPHAHRFRRSHGLNPAEFVSLVTADPIEAREVLHALFAAQGLVGFAHVEGGTEGEADHYVWGCTWLEPPDP